MAIGPERAKGFPMKMHDRRQSSCALALAFALVLGSGALLHAQSGFEPRPFKCSGRCERIANAFIRADVGPNGTWVVGTTGGDPNTAADDDKNLLFGFKPGGESSVGTGYTSLHVRGSRGTTDTYRLEPSPQTVEAERIATIWNWERPEDVYRLQVTQTLRLRQNTFSGRPDIVGIDYEILNRDSETLDVGLRALLDIKLGNNDGAPYFIPGVGTVDQEISFEGDAVPSYWLAFESPVYDARELRSIGILRDEGLGLTVPDRFVIAEWRGLLLSPWDFEVDASQPITSDSAVALYWQPVALAPGQRLHRTTAYGVSSSGGGRAFLSSKVEADCGETVELALFVTNSDSQALSGGRADLELPAGWSLASGSLQQPIPTIDPGETGSAIWQVRVPAGASGNFDLRATASFDGDRAFEATSEIEIRCLPTATASPRPSVTATAPASPTPEPAAAEACDLILARVPPAAISAALANPQAVFGWMQPGNPGLPPGPNNPPRRWLSLRDIGKAYHPLFNPLIFKVGCP